MRTLFLYWEKDGRYYAARLEQDLFEDWIVSQSWGSVISRLGGFKQQCFIDYDQAIVCIEQLKNRRRVRGYRLVHDQWI